MEIETSDYRFGMIIFDDIKNPSSGWASREGEPAKRVEGVHQLSTGTYWWTNCDYSAFFRETEIGRNPWLKHDAYLVVTPKNLMKEWDMDVDIIPPNTQAEFCSKMFSRIMNMAFLVAKKCDDKLSMKTFFKDSSRSLRDDFRAFLPPAEYPKGEAASIMQNGQAFSEFTRTGSRGMKGAKAFKLIRPRLVHAMDMLTTPIPVGQFTFKNRSELRQLSTNRVSYVLNQNIPIMAEITVDTMNGDIAPIYAFGNSVDKDKRVPRSWVPHSEFIAMSSFSELNVVSAFFGEKYSTLGQNLPAEMVKFLQQDFGNMSWSAGVIAETIWRAASLAQEKFKVQKDSDRPMTSWRGAWLKSADKTVMFMTAMKLNDLDYNVMSYGLGWVLCMIQEDQKNDLIRDGLSLGLLPAMVDIPDGMYSDHNIKTAPWGGDKQTFNYVAMELMKDKQTLLEFDTLPLYEESRRADIIKKIIKGRKQRASS